MPQKMVRRWFEPATRKERRFPELGRRQSTAGGAWGEKWVEDSLMRQPTSCEVWLQRKSGACLNLLKGRAHTALMRRWCSMLGCTAARSYALPLLDRVPAGADGPTPSIQEVLRTVTSEGGTCRQCFCFSVLDSLTQS